MVNENALIIQNNDHVKVNNVLTFAMINAA